MTIYYLYVKTHNITGLKYLGYTSSQDPHKYKGSGIYWKNHLKVHGDSVSTEILLETGYKNEIKVQGIFYSKLWNVVISDSWANLKEESGEGGFLLSSESHKKRIETRSRNGNLNTNTPESIKKALETRTRNGNLNVQSPEVIAKSLATKIKNNTLNSNTPESIAKGLETKKKNGTYGKNNITPESIAKCNATKIKNGTNKRSIESINKQKATVVSKGGNKHSDESKQKMKGIRSKCSCPHCGKLGGIAAMKRWHFDNCKLQ